MKTRSHYHEKAIDLLSNPRPRTEADLHFEAFLTPSDYRAFAATEYEIASEIWFTIERNGNLQADWDVLPLAFENVSLLLKKANDLAMGTRQPVPDSLWKLQARFNKAPHHAKAHPPRSQDAENPEEARLIKDIFGERA